MSPELLADTNENVNTHRVLRIPIINVRGLVLRAVRFEVKILHIMQKKIEPK